MKNSNIRKIKIGVRLFDFLLILSFITLALVITFNFNYFETHILDLANQYGYAALFFINLFLELIPQFITPVITLLPSLLFKLNPHLVILFVVLGSLIGSILGYEIGNKNGCNVVCNFVKKKKLDKTKKFMDSYGKLAVLIAAISPLPYLPMIIGSLHMKRKYFAIYGLLPRAIALTFIGYLFYFNVI